MDQQRFDEITKALATGTSRRRVLKTLGSGLAAGLAGLVGAGRVGANPPPKHCKFQGYTCKTNAECCTLNCCNRLCCGDGQSCVNGQCTLVTCTPNNAAACGTKQCGTATNNCGQTVACGANNGGCPSGQSCNGSGQCVCVDNGQACGTKQCGTAINNCGQTVTCGANNGGCPSSAGVCYNGVCCAPRPDAEFCTPGICNRPTNNCGQTVICGCTERQTCSDGTCCGAIYESCDPANDDCCNASTCKTTLAGANVCCGVSGVSPCDPTTPAELDWCCSGGCNPVTLVCV